MIFSAPFAQSNLMAVVMTVPADMSFVDRDTLKRIIEDRSFKIEGLNDDIHRRRFYKPLFPEFTLNETADRDVEKFVTKHLSTELFEMDILFFEPYPGENRVRRAWLCQRMTLDTFTSVPGRRDVAGKPPPVSSVCIRLESHHTSRAAPVIKAAEQILTQMVLVSSSPYKSHGHISTD